MEIHRLVWLLACLLNFEETFGVPVYRSYQGLTTIPANIDQSVTVLYLQGNAISSIQKSDFNDKYPLLDHIYIHSNIITTIENGCFKGTVLKQVKIYNNQLTFFPDFREFLT